MALVTKEQFLVEHNRLSPMHLRATLPLLVQFQKEKKPLLKDDGWSVDKLRIPFISWLLSLSQQAGNVVEQQESKQVFKSYPDTKS